jgi:uncharacterized protein (TIGR00156 family)
MDMTITRLLVFIGVGMLAASASAQFRDTGPAGTSSVADVKKAKDETWHTLEGNIVKQLSSEHYTFRDATGEIEIEVEDDAWSGQEVTPQTRVRITGEVDRDFRSVSFEVETLEPILAESPGGGTQ